MLKRQEGGMTREEVKQVSNCNPFFQTHFFSMSKFLLFKEIYITLVRNIINKHIKNVKIYRKEIKNTNAYYRQQENSDRTRRKFSFKVFWTIPVPVEVLGIFSISAALISNTCSIYAVGGYCRRMEIWSWKFWGALVKRRRRRWWWPWLGSPARRYCLDIWSANLAPAPTP